ncbi:MAG: enoyl-CoA hydratase/isomerase family protein [Planctomycetia bacterium]|nr:enoyl-CoA hydratase/isomerase family protein [Planctomycetia bacterium]
MSSSVILINHQPHATIIAINRPERRNALNRELVTALTNAFQAALTDQSRCLILTGTEKAFCAGMDLAELSETLDKPDEAQRVHEDAGRLSNLFELIYSHPKPTIAAVNGAAVAGGAGLVSVCDLAIADPGAKLGYPEVKRGLVAAMVMPHLLRLVGERAARDLLLTGRLVDASEAFRMGFINEVVDANLTANDEALGIKPATSALDRALAIAKELGESSPNALTITKRLLAECRAGAAANSGLARESADARLHIEAKSGLKAFLDKKPVPWVKP